MTKNIKTVIGKRTTFLWVEHLDPSDGIGFAHAAKKWLDKDHPEFDNLAELADANLVSTKIDIPVRHQNYPKTQQDIRAGIIVDSMKQIETLDAFDLKLKNYRGWVAFNPDRNHGVPDKADNAKFISSPFAVCKSIEYKPNIYILSGHGHGGHVFGEADDTLKKGVSDAHVDQIRPYPGLKLLIVSCCSNVSIGNAPRYMHLFEENEVFAVLGYVDTYAGGGNSAHVFSEFAERIRKGEEILAAWEKANKKRLDAGEKFPWGAIFSESDQHFTIKDLMMRTRKPGTIVHKSCRESTPREVKYPEILSIFCSIEKQVDPEYNPEEFAQRLENKLANALVGDGKATEPCVDQPTYWYTRYLDDKRTFKKGDVLIFKFCVVRPNFKEQLSIFELFPEGIHESPSTYILSALPDKMGSMLKLTVNSDSDLKSLLIPMKFSNEIITYLVRKAAPDGPELVLYIAECTTKNGVLVLKADDQPFPVNGPEEDPRGSAASWWRLNTHAMDLSALATTFQVKPPPAQNLQVQNTPLTDVPTDLQVPGTPLPDEPTDLQEEAR